TLVALPGMGAFAALTSDLGLLLGAYRGFSPPAPGVDSSPELSWNLEGGLRYHARDTKLEAIGFYNDYENLTDVCTFATGCVGTDVDQQFDAGRARIFGVETLAQHELHAGQLKVPLSASYTFSRGHFGNTFQSEDPVFGAVQRGD